MQIENKVLPQSAKSQRINLQYFVFFSLRLCVLAVKERTILLEEIIDNG